MMKKILLLIICLILQIQSVSAKSLTKTEIKGIQTKIFEKTDRKTVANSIIRVLYDSDFVIEEFDNDLGFIRAKKTFKQHYINKGRLAANSLYFGAMAAYTVFSYGATAASMFDPGVKIKNELRNKNVVVDVNVNIENFGKDNVRVRFIPVKKIQQNADGYTFMKPATIKVIHLYNKNLYNEFFNQVESGLKCNI